MVKNREIRRIDFRTGANVYKYRLSQFYSDIFVIVSISAVSSSMLFADVL